MASSSDDDEYSSLAEEVLLLKTFSYIMFQSVAVCQTAGARIFSL